jgi:hypothetical protein
MSFFIYLSPPCSSSEETDKLKLDQDRKPSTRTKSTTLENNHFEDAKEEPTEERRLPPETLIEDKPTEEEIVALSRCKNPFDRITELPAFVTFAPPNEPEGSRLFRTETESRNPEQNTSRLFRREAGSRNPEQNTLLFSRKNTPEPEPSFHSLFPVRGHSISDLIMI